jgi:hypothetical protein
VWIRRDWRYERERAGELVPLDVKPLGPKIGVVGHRIHSDRRRCAPGIGYEFVHIPIDDASRSVRSSRGDCLEE